MFSTLIPNETVSGVIENAATRNFNQHSSCVLQNSNSSQKHKQPKSLVHHPSSLNSSHMIQHIKGIHTHTYIYELIVDTKGDKSINHREDHTLQSSNTGIT